MDRCPEPNCFVDEDTTCYLGHMRQNQCPQWQMIKKVDTSTAPGANGMFLPWSGMAMGEHDLSFVSGRVKPITVGIVGPESAGKTTILAAFYLLLGRGMLSTPQYGFSSSYTFSGWEAVANCLRWQPGQLPHFPAHTSSRAARVPGLLHLGFRHEGGSLRDLMFADAPGEWFQKWSINEETPEAEGARWIARHADVTLLVADRQALAGERMGAARNEFQLLAQRAVAQSKGRRIALVWTKSDVPILQAMEERIRKAVAEHASAVPEFSVSVFPGEGREPAEKFGKLFTWILATRRLGIDLPLTPTTIHDPLFRFGRR